MTLESAHRRAQRRDSPFIRFGDTGPIPVVVPGCNVAR